MKPVINLLVVAILFFSSSPAATMPEGPEEEIAWPSIEETLDDIPGYYTYLAQQLDLQEATLSERYWKAFYVKELLLPPPMCDYDCKIIDLLSTELEISFGLHSWSIRSINCWEGKGIRLMYNDGEDRSLDKFHNALQQIFTGIKAGWIETRCPDTHVSFPKILSLHDENKLIDLLLAKFNLHDHIDCFYCWNTQLEEEILYLSINKTHLEEFQRIFNFDLQITTGKTSAAADL